MSPVPAARPWVEVRGIYGWHPPQADSGTSLTESGINAVFMGSETVTRETADSLHAQGIQVFAEFNAMHEAGYLKDRPDAAPVGPRGDVCPPPDGWQGVCPTHAGYRRWRMARFQHVLAGCGVDGMWLDYHHSHSSWEQAEPNLPNTCFCGRCLEQFEQDTGIDIPHAPTADVSARLLGEHRDQWVQWRCDVFTDWVRELREIIDNTRPGALLGTFHCPWDDTDRGGALRDKLAIDLKAQSAYMDVFSTMPYHARFGHPADPEWISRQVSWLGGHLGIEGKPGERHRIWPIVQLSDWGEQVPADQVAAVLDHGTRPPATGVTIFAWDSLRKQPEKVAEMARFYLSIRP